MMKNQLFLERTVVAMTLKININDVVDIIEDYDSSRNCYYKTNLTSLKVHPPFPHCGKSLTQSSIIYYWLSSGQVVSSQYS